MTEQNAVATQQQQAPARQPSAKKTIKDTLEGDSFKLAVAKVLPKHLTADRFVRVAIMAMTRTPKLAQCDQASFFQALMNLSQMGLEPDGRHAHLIPFNNTRKNIVECQLIVDFKGLAELVMRSGMVSNLHADVVCENDEFAYDRGQLQTHKIDFKKPRGPVYAAYALCRFKDGTEKCDVMTKDEIEGIRKRSRAANNGPWVTDWNEMAKKTVFRRLSKWLSLSPEFRDALDKDADALAEVQLDGLKTATVSSATFDMPAATQIEEGDPNEEKVVELPTQEEKPKEQPKDKPKQNHVKAIKGLLALSNITEIELMDFLHAGGKVDDSIGTLSAMQEVAAVTLAEIHDNWGVVSAEIKKLKAAQ